MKKWFARYALKRKLTLRQHKTMEKIWRIIRKARLGCVVPGQKDMWIKNCK